MSQVKKAELCSISAGALQGCVPLCTEHKSASRTLPDDCVSPSSLGSGPKGKGVLEACAIDIQSHVQNFTSMRVKA